MRVWRLAPNNRDVKFLCDLFHVSVLYTIKSTFGFNLLERAALKLGALELDSWLSSV